MHSFKAIIQIIGINPFVFVPEKVLRSIFKKAGKDKGHIPVCGTVNGKPYTQTLVKYSGHWRLYINTTMLKDSPKHVGETIVLTISFDPADRSIAMHPKLENALKDGKAAKAVFDKLSPYRRKEIVRYIAALKTEESIERNVQRAIQSLLGNGSFAGRGNSR